MPLELVAVDIETTGFAVSDAVTVVGFAVPMGVRVFLQTDGRDAPEVASEVQACVESPVQASTHKSEGLLFEAVGSFAEERLKGNDVLLVGFNGEVWKSGFDLPFLRTRFAQCDVAWPFTDVPYADVLPVVTNRFNTTAGDGDSRSDLPGVYATLCDGQYDDVDPFVESEEAVTAFDDGRFGELVQHNVADVLRTRALGRLAQRYCSKSDFKVKSLTPASQP